MRKLDFIATSEAITGYSDSKLAKTENRDCVVRAIASASRMSIVTGKQIGRAHV